MTDVPKKAIKLFYSYIPHPKDEVLRRELEKHLAGLERRGLIESWSRREIIAGKNQQEEINKHLETASVILLLISPDFIASDYYYGAEMMRAMERQQTGDARVIPILLRPVFLEDEPFIRLASLPTNGRPISMWRNRDEAFVDIARGISKSIKDLQTSSPSIPSVRRDPFRFANEVASYFTSLAIFLESEGRWFQDDFERGRIYVPEKEYFHKIEKALNAKHRVLLLGRSAAGKTVLAIALAKRLHDQADYIVGYKDVKQAEVGNGRKWYTLMREHDQSGMLFILDNCHLAPKEVDEFCRQWREQPPINSQCILISRTNQQEMQARDGSYFQTFTDDEKIQVYSEDIFWQVIEQNVTMCYQQNPGYAIALKSDDMKMLEKQHAHNLAILRARLDAWRTLGSGHHLNEVRQEDIHHALEARYLSIYNEALAVLCVLQRYEIRAHASFVEKKLLRDEVKKLQEEKLLISSTVTNYGRLYDLVLHPAEARELFIAYVFKQYGNVTQENINILAASALEAYLRAKPTNYVAIYESLARQRQGDILEQLLTNRDLQECTASQFNKGVILDAIRYVYRVTKFDIDSASKLINKVVQITGVQGICSTLLKSTFQDVALLLQYMKHIDADLANKVVDVLNTEQLAQRTKEESIQGFFRLVGTLQNISPTQASAFLSSIPTEDLVAKVTVRNLQAVIKQLQANDYSSVQLKQFVESLDAQQLAQQCDKVTLQSLFWMLYALEKISPSQAQTLLGHIPLWMLSMKASVSSLGPIEQIVQLMQEFGYTAEQMAEFAEALDIEQVAQHAKQGNLRRFALLLRSLKSISAPTATRLLEELTPADIANLYHSNGATIADVEQLRKASTRSFWNVFLQHCSPQDTADLFRRSPMGVIGTFLRYEYAARSVSEGYTLFQEQFLRSRLATEPLNEIGEFFDRVRGMGQRGQALARKALDLLVTTDITERVTHADLRQFALLLHHAQSIDRTDLLLLLTPLRQPTVLQNALDRSDVHGIQLLIFNVANMETSYLKPIQQSLQNSNITEKLEKAPIRDIGLFLWNVYRYIDERMAQRYCANVDMQQRTRRLKEASLEDLCLFLWNLTSISNSTGLRTFDNPIIQQFLVKSLSAEIGWNAVLLGIAALAQAPLIQHDHLPSMQIHEEQLANWFAMSSGGRNPYFLALALHGLRIYNEEIAQALVRNALPLAETLHLLRSARASAITSRSIMLMEEIMQWLERLVGEKR